MGDQLARSFARDDIALLIHNAGILRDDGLDAIDPDQVRAQFEINALAPLRLSAALAPRLSRGAAPTAANATNSIDLIYDGIATPNTRAAPTTVEAFNVWCATGSACIPTVQQPMYDMSTGQLKGTIYVWATVPFNAGSVIPSAFCFSEFFVVALAEGDLHAHSGPNGTCGATMDPVMKPPKFPELGATVVIAGGGDGVIVGGTGKFRKWSGTFTDRVFVGFGAPTSGVGGIVYYDQLMFSFTGK